MIIRCVFFFYITIIILTSRVLQRQCLADESTIFSFVTHRDIDVKHEYGIDVNPYVFTTSKLEMLVTGEFETSSDCTGESDKTI